MNLQRRFAAAFVLVAGLLSASTFVAAADQLNTSAYALLALRSRSGDSVAEAYYQEVGKQSSAYAKWSLALAMAIVSVSLGTSYLVAFGLPSSGSEVKPDQSG